MTSAFFNLDNDAFSDIELNINILYKDISVSHILDIP